MINTKSFAIFFILATFVALYADTAEATKRYRRRSSKHSSRRSGKYHKRNYSRRSILSRRSWSQPRPTPEPTVAPTPCPTCSTCPECEAFVGVHPETCGGVQTSHGMWLWFYDGEDFWQGPRPLVTPADFEISGDDARLTGVVVNGGTHYKYEFEFHGLTNNGTGYFQELGVGCIEPDMSDWKFYPEFNGTLTNLVTGDTHALAPRDGPHHPQIGTAASLLDTGYGISFWFEIPGTTVIGDINLSLKCISSF